MANSISRRTTFKLAGGLAVLPLIGCQTTGTGASSVAPGANYFDSSTAPFPQFSKFAETSRYKFDFSIWSEFLEEMVIDFGPSEGRPASELKPALGTRVTSGHKSKYRLEANRIPFSMFTDESLELVSALRADLEDMGNSVPLDNFFWTSQMAFWTNLHNAIVIEQIAKNYPVRSPSKLRIGDNNELLHDAKITNIQGVALSLRDIRVEIVYRYWRFAPSIYGFFHGDIGGPSILPVAFTEKNIARLLTVAADEFVNSLRGVRMANAQLVVSSVYDEARPLFPDWSADLIAHLSKFADPDLLAELNSNPSIRATNSDPIVADLLGGNQRDPLSLTYSCGNSAESCTEISGVGATQRQQATQLLEARREKLHRQHIARLRELKRNKKRGTVEIIDMPSAPVE